MSTFSAVECNNCQKQVREKDAHGWFSLRTVVTMPTPEQYEQLRERYGEALAASGLSEGKPRPELVGGEFCSTKCLRQYVDSADLLMTLPTQAESVAERRKLIETLPDYEKPKGYAELAEELYQKFMKQKKERSTPDPEPLGPPQPPEDEGDSYQ